MLQPPWRRFLLALAGLLAAACGPATRFNTDNAQAHVERLTANGSRWTGTPANEKARAYLIETLQLYGFEVRVQEADAQWREGGVTTRIANLVAIKPGEQRDAIALVAHYDSVAWGPGAGDDAIGTAVALEAARVLGARQSPRYTLMVLLTDGEEHGLMGARALAADPEVRARLKTFINLEAIGTDTPFVLFETGPGTSPALRAWTRTARPRGGSYMQSIYDALPNDTDFSVLSQLPGVSGINFAATGDGYTYHTDRDRADRVTRRVLSAAGSVVLDVVDGLDARADLTADASPSMYVSVLERVALMWPLRTGVFLGWLVAGLALLAWLAVVRTLWRGGGAARVIVTGVWALLASGAVLCTLVAAVWLVRAGRAELHPWFAHPWRLFAFMTTMVVTVSWGVRRLAAVAPVSLRPDGTPFGVWFVALPVWMKVLVASLLYAPAASYLAWLPLAGAIVAVTVGLVFAGRSTGPLRTWPARVASALVAIGTWALWGPDLATLLGFTVTMLERLPIVTPTWAFPVVLFVAGIFLWPPVLAVLVGRARWRLGHGLAGGVLMAALVVTGLLAWRSPAYTPERPQQRAATFVDDRIRQVAAWDVGGNEPGVDIGAGGPDSVTWQPAGEALLPGMPSMPRAYRFRAMVPPSSDPPPATVTAVVSRGVTTADVEVTVTPQGDDWRTVSVVLPEAVVPTASSLVGRTRAGRWQAQHTSVPAEGLVWRATIPLSQADRLTEAEVWISRFGLPGADATQRVPAWLQTPHTAWATRHTVALPIVVSEVAQTPMALAPLALPLPAASPATAAPLQPAATPGPRPPQ